VELCCPIGQFRGKQKFLFGYWALLNLSPEHRCVLRNIQVAFIVHSDHVKTYGITAIVSGVKDKHGAWVDDSSFGASMRRFASGVLLENLPEPHCSKKHYGALLQVASDGKVIHTRPWP